MEIKTTFGKLPVGEYFNLEPNQQYGWNAWTRCFDNRGTNARRDSDFRNFSGDTVVYVRAHGKKLKGYKERMKARENS